jgi:endonuclease/exonuclease/phosphatase family metal-dependent hydrolase
MFALIMRKRIWTLIMVAGLLGGVFSGLAATITNLVPRSQPLKIRIGTFNVGHFNQGKLGGYQEADFPAALVRWRNWIQQQAFDIFFINEWNFHFDKDKTLNATDELLKPFYDRIIFGQENTWIYNGIATNFEITNRRQVQLTHKEYYAVVADWRVRGITITLMSVHVPWQKNFHESSIDALIAEMKRHEYLICCGDLNAPDRNVLKIKNAGFKVANGGDEGWFCTAAKRCAETTVDVHIDNIITSPNLTIRRVSAPHTGLNDQDHLPLLAEVEIPQ